MCDPFLRNKIHSITANHSEDIGLNRKWRFYIFVRRTKSIEVKSRKKSLISTGRQGVAVSLLPVSVLNVNDQF